MNNFIQSLPFAAALLLGATSSKAQTVYATVGIIGSATAKGWGASTPMTLVSANNPHIWTITLPLVGNNAVKFRANDDWSVNWGGAAFPTGTGTQNGPDIPISTNNTYTVRFDDTTGNYQFTTSTLATLAASSAPVLHLALAPNPAQEAVRIAYELPAAATVSLSVRNVMGQLVRQLAPVRQGAGSQTQELPHLGLAAGVYLVQLQADGQHQTARLVVK